MCFLKFSATSLKWHWLPGVSRWLVRVIPYSTLSCSTQSYRVRLRAVLFSHMDVIYRKMECGSYINQSFYVQLYQESNSPKNLDPSFLCCVNIFLHRNAHIPYIWYRRVRITGEGHNKKLMKKSLITDGFSSMRIFP